MRSVPEPQTRAAGHDAHATVSAAVEHELHSLSQPLTSLMCQLELGKMLGDAESMHAALNAGLVECRRLFSGFEAMRDKFCGGAAETQKTEKAAR